MTTGARVGGRGGEGREPTYDRAIPNYTYIYIYIPGMHTEGHACMFFFFSFWTWLCRKLTLNASPETSMFDPLVLRYACGQAQVFDDYVSMMDKSSTLLTGLPTPVFWYGLVVGQEFSMPAADPAQLLLKDNATACVAQENGGPPLYKIRLVRVGPAKKGGMRTVSFTVGGAVQNVEIKDSIAGNDFDGPMAAAGDPLQASWPFVCFFIRPFADRRRAALAGFHKYTTYLYREKPIYI